MNEASPAVEMECQLELTITTSGKSTCMGKCRIYKPELNAEVVLASPRSQKIEAPICRKREIAPELPSRWQTQLNEVAAPRFCPSKSIRARPPSAWLGSSLDLGLFFRLICL